MSRRRRVLVALGYAGIAVALLNAVRILWACVPIGAWVLSITAVPSVMLAISLAGLIWASRSSD